MKKLYDIFQGEDLRIAEKIQQRRLQMIVHSCLYYVMNDSIISDHKWAEWGKELMLLQIQHPEISNKVPLAEHFTDWDASTGFNLPINEDWVMEKAERLLGGIK